MIPGLLRLEYVLVNRSRLVMAAFAIAAVVAFAGAGYAMANPPTEEITEEENQQTVTTDFYHKAVVTSNESLWENGTVLENRNFYPMGSADNLTLQIRTSASNALRLDATHRVALVYYSNVDGSRIWDREQPVTPVMTTTEDGSVVSTVTLDVPAILEQVESYNDKLVGVGSTKVDLVLQVNYSTGLYSGGYSSTAELKLSKSGFQVNGELGSDRSHSTTATRTVERPLDTTTVGGILLMAVLSTAVAGGTRHLAETRDAQAIRDEIDRKRCSEWISEGLIRQPIGGQDVMMRSLSDLVNVGIDSKERVIHDPDRDLYAIMDSGMLYYYDPMEELSEQAARSEEVVGGDLQDSDSPPQPESAEKQGPTETPDDPTAGEEQPAITIDEADSRAWNQLMAEDQLDPVEDSSTDSDSSTETVEDRAWEQLMEEES